MKTENKSNNLAAYYFHQGTNYYSYKYLGSNFVKHKNTYEYTFRTWAPNADSVSLVSDFTDWNNGFQMRKITERGIWECVYKSNMPLNLNSYKYKIERNGKKVLKGDPYAKYSKGGADGASLIFESKYKWSDSNWRRYRKRHYNYNSEPYLQIPVNIYEVHLGSFVRRSDNSYFNYRELAEILVPYIKYMGYTHIELLPITEYPYDGSWGYQVCGFFSPTSRYGTPDDFKYFIDLFHQNGVGVIIDWVPAHFPKDEWGLFEFDGSPLYEYQGFDRQESKTWGTRFFDLGREEVQSFLVSSAMYFLREFHLDGIRVDAVASILYLDYDKEPGKWFPNPDGSNINLEAVAFLKKLNSAVFSEFSDVLMIAEESGSYNGVTRKISEDGLGFNLKWNMGWANDFYDYMSTNPYLRKYKHKALNFPLMYAFSEKYIMPVSHDEVVHGKRSLIDKMYGLYEDKFKQMREFLLLMMTYPGKKLLFMGCEFAQFREWDFENSLEWFMLDYDKHRAMREYVASLNRFYLSNKELWDLDFSQSGFEWILPDESEKNIVSFKRYDNTGKYLMVVINFSGSEKSTLINTDERELECVFTTDISERIEIKSLNEDLKEVILPKFSGVVLRNKDIGLSIEL